MRAPDDKGEFQPLGPPKRKLEEEARKKDMPTPVVKVVRPGIRTVNGKFETFIPGNELAKLDWVKRKALQSQIENWCQELMNRAYRNGVFIGE